jgi:hypothetical protein
MNHGLVEDPINDVCGDSTGILVTRAVRGTQSAGCGVFINGQPVAAIVKVRALLTSRVPTRILVPEGCYIMRRQLAIVVISGLFISAAVAQSSSDAKPYDDQEACKIYSLLLPHEESYGFAPDTLMIQNEMLPETFRGLV